MTNSNDYNQSDSIFSNPQMEQRVPAAVNVPPNEALPGFFEKITSKLFNQDDKKQKELQKKLETVMAENEDIFSLLLDNGCTISMEKSGFKLKCEAINLEGRVLSLKNGKVEFDPDAQEIMRYVADLLIKKDNLDLKLSDYEEQEFYPVGELEKVKIKLNGEECEVLTGMMANPQGETKRVFFYKGEEVTPDN